MYQTLIEPAELHEHLARAGGAAPSAGWVIVDCRFELSDPAAGRAAYLDGHIPGAVYAHLDQDLSGEIVAGLTGRHPLPEPRAFRRLLGQWGISPGTQVVAYDQGPGAIAARLWWLLRHHGHEAVAVLNGGFAAWEEGQRPVARSVGLAGGGSDAAGGGGSDAAGGGGSDAASAGDDSDAAAPGGGSDAASAGDDSDAAAPGDGSDAASAGDDSDAAAPGDGSDAASASPASTRGTSAAGVPYPVRPPLAHAALPEEWAGVLVDARAPERYLGESEPIDPVAGHIPGALNRPFGENLTDTGRFRSPEELRARFAGLAPPEQQLHYCGSGVTAAHNLLAMEVAGLSGARLYAGSWSDWITDPDRPVAKT